MIIMVATILCAAMMPVMAASFDFEKALEESKPIETLDYTVGEVDDFFAFWSRHGYECYSSDESIIEIDSHGNVRAMAEGQAYAVVVFSEEMYKLYAFEVSVGNAAYNDLENAYTIGAIGSIDNNSNGNTQSNDFDKDFSDIFADTNELDDEIDKIREEALKNHRNNMKHSSGFRRLMATFPLFFVIFFSVLTLVIVEFVNVFSLSKKSMGKKELPAVCETANTVKTARPDRVSCPKCGKEFNDAAFCTECGTPKKQKNKYVFSIPKKMTAQDFEIVINQWLAENPYIYDCKLNIDTKTSIFSLILQRRFFVKSASIEYHVADKPQQGQYGMAFIYKWRMFGPLGYNTEKHVAEWNKNNPDCKVLKTHGGRIQHWDSNGGIYAQYYNYVFFKK